VDGLGQVVEEIPFGVGSLIKICTREYNFITEKNENIDHGYGIAINLRIQLGSNGLLTREPYLEVGVQQINSSQKIYFSYASLLRGSAQRYHRVAEICNATTNSWGEDWIEKYKITPKEAKKISLFNRGGTKYSNKRNRLLADLSLERARGADCTDFGNEYVDSWKAPNIIKKFRKGCTKL